MKNQPLGLLILSFMIFELNFSLDLYYLIGHLNQELKLYRMTNAGYRSQIKRMVAIASTIILITAFAFVNSNFNHNPSVAIGENKQEPASWPAPDTLISGIPVYHTFARLKPVFEFDNDTTYVINFWATWCKPCVEELPILETLNSKSKKEKIKVVLVSLDFAEQVESKLIPFVQKQELKSTVLLLLDHNFNKWINEISPEWSGAIPATYIYKRDQSQIILKKFDTLEELEASIKPFL